MYNCISFQCAVAGDSHDSRQWPETKYASLIMPEESGVKYANVDITVEKDDQTGEICLFISTDNYDGEMNVKMVDGYGNTKQVWTKTS